MPPPRALEAGDARQRHQLLVRRLRRGAHRAQDAAARVALAAAPRRGLVSPVAREAEMRVRVDQSGRAQEPPDIGHRVGVARAEAARLAPRSMQPVLDDDDPRALDGLRSARRARRSSAAAGPARRWPSGSRYVEAEPGRRRPAPARAGEVDERSVAHEPVAASRSGPGSRSCSRRGDDGADARVRLGDPDARPRARAAGRRAGRGPGPRRELDGQDALACSRTRRAWRAAIEPIETWSSWLAEVGIESAEAGWASTLDSEASAAAVYWRIMSPESSPEADPRKAGRPSLRRGSRSSATRRSLMEPSSAMASLAKSSARATGSPWKLPPLMTRPRPVARASVGDLAALGEDERVVGRRVHLDVEHARAGGRARRATAPWTWGTQRSGVRVLDPVRVRRGGQRCSSLSRSSQRSSAAVRTCPGCGRVDW